MNEIIGVIIGIIGLMVFGLVYCEVIKRRMR